MLGRLPQTNVKLKVRGVWAENELGQKETKVIKTPLTEGLVKDWVPVHAEQEYVIIIEVTKENFGFKVTTDTSLIDLSFKPIVVVGQSIFSVVSGFANLACQILT